MTEDNLASIPSEPGAAGGEQRRRLPPRGVLAAAAVVVVVAFGGGVFVGSRLPEPQDPRYPCPGPVIAIIDATELEDAAVTVLAPLQAPAAPDLVPVDPETTLVLKGEEEGEGSYRPEDGQLALAVRIPREAAGRQGAVVSDVDGRFVAQPILTLAPLCEEQPGS